MLHTKKVRLTGKQPLLMANGQVVDPLNEWSKQVAQIRKDAKKAKTDKAIRAANRVEWLSAVYQDVDRYPTLPIDNFLACLTKSAKMYRLGPKVAAGVFVLGGSRLSFNGNGQDKTVDELVDMPEYAHRKRTKRGVIAHRPIFNTWSIEYDVSYDDAIIDPEDFAMILETAGKVGIGAWTARFGKFNVEEVA